MSYHSDRERETGDYDEAAERRRRFDRDGKEVEREPCPFCGRLCDEDGVCGWCDN